MHGHAFQQQQGGRRIFFRTAPEEFRGADALDGFDRGWTYIINEICKLTDNQKKTPSFSEMSGKYGYLKRYIGKMFKKFTEISFSDYKGSRPVFAQKRQKDSIKLKPLLPKKNIPLFAVDSIFYPLIMCLFDKNATLLIYAFHKHFLCYNR